MLTSAGQYAVARFVKLEGGKGVNVPLFQTALCLQ